MLWLTADWHLGEDRFEIMQRPFKTVEDHISTLIERHNSLVKPDDDVIVAGDAVYQKAPQYVDCIQHFNGRKTLIRGNHDRPIDDNTYAKYFDIIIEEGGGIPLEAGSVPCWVTHYPSQGRQDIFNLVGHVHGAWKYQLNMFNIGVDANHFLPVAADRVKFHFDAVSQYYDGDIWIAYSPLNSFYCGRRGKSSYYYNKTD